MVFVKDVSRAMKGMCFPADKQQCVKWAQQHDATAEVVQALERMPKNRFKNMSDIWYAIG
ncbi:DUF2795 domain-containing protein [Methanocella sp. MCL-LM]|uniref:DUF2795 domain-containing protein n=1 Tax=Methanocella sp. MCL-LM TaxID=3412035 RepID=UPI003C792A8E